MESRVRTLSRIHIPLVPSESSTCSFFPRVTHPITQHISVFWMRQEGSEFLWQRPASLGQVSSHFQAHTFPSRRNQGLKRCLLALSCAAVGKADACRLKLFFHSSQISLLQWYAGTSPLDPTRLLSGLPQSYLIHGWLSKLMFFRRNMVENTYSTMITISSNSLVKCHCGIHSRYGGNQISFRKRWLMIFLKLEF